MPDGDPARGCLTAISFLFGLAVLCGIGSCALLNSTQIAIGFPDGLHYDHVLAFEQQPGLMEGCVFVAYHMTDKRIALSHVGLPRSDNRNPYSSYMPTPITLDRITAMISGRKRVLYALGAEGGCNAGTDVVTEPRAVLQESGNFFAVSDNGEGLSIISPSRHLVLFLYFG